MDVRFDEDVDAADAVEVDFFVFVVAPVAEFDEVGPSGVVFLVACFGAFSDSSLGGG